MLWALRRSSAFAPTVSPTREQITASPMAITTTETKDKGTKTSTNDGSSLVLPL
ncbi:hypothetical protein [Streptomyces sp. NPDC060198]|uniref:hypothetical protein n=1 Tax=Streptomyces sp. NPDC060198 TaxID=3347070 RepID=UPI00365CD41D